MIQTPDRRQILALGATAVVATPSSVLAQNSSDAALKGLLDEMAASPEALRKTAAENIARLDAFPPQGLSLSARLDRQSVLDLLGAWAATDRLFPDGAPKAGSARGVHYTLAVRAAGGPRIAPHDVQRLTGDLIGSLNAEADALLKAQGLGDGSVAHRLQTMMTMEGQLYPDSDAGRDQVVADMNASLAKVRLRLDRAFDRLPPANLRVSRMSPADETAGRAGYRDAALGAYFVDLKNVRARPRWTLPSVAFHEVSPGHLLQLAQPANPHPLRVRAAAGYSEGWAIYGEQLADELGLYSNDPLGRLGYLHWMLFRTARMAADCGIHSQGWSRDQALSEMRRIQGPAIAFTTLERDVDQIARNPGQTTAQALMWREMVRLRQAHKRRKAGRFELPAFHRMIIGHGPATAPALASALS
ncbi:DUF885 family protein [Caulobacter sp. NIBR2454]|uniref:DUF885 family protein n=1 Tax=Caulobacter sp. NIBR2454 TaxID=3015996 RepID=UPI0022B657A0|nr:DUF885 family protein [Caulobacter sp. NIBR2454]